MPWPATSPMTAATRVGVEAEEVVEVARHHPGAGLVDAADLEADEVGQGLGRQALGPHAGRPLLLVEHLDGPPLHADAALGQAGLGDERRATWPARSPRGSTSRPEDDRARRRVRRRQRPDGHAGDRVEGRRCAGPCGRRPTRARWRLRRSRSCPAPASTRCRKRAPNVPRTRPRPGTAAAMTARTGITMSRPDRTASGPRDRRRSAALLTASVRTRSFSGASPSSKASRSLRSR